MQIYFHSRLCSYLPRVPILVEGTVYSLYNHVVTVTHKIFFYYTELKVSLTDIKYQNDDIVLSL